MTGAELDAAKLAAARLWAASRLPYLASAVFASTPRATPGSGTVAVDRAWRLCVDPSVLDDLEVEQLGRLLLHLTGHVLRDHATRAEVIGVDDATSAAWWNRCVDAEINDDLEADGYVPSVASDLPADIGCADGGLAEVYYASVDPLPQPADGAGDPSRCEPGDRPGAMPSWDCGSGADALARAWDDGDGSDGLNPAKADLLRMGVATEMQRGNQQNPGSVPAGWLRWAEAIRPSRIDWRRVLAAEIRSAVAAISGKVDYTYRRPSRRGQATPGIVLPSLFQPIPEVAIVCDTSGSMHEHLLDRALAEVESLLARTGLRANRVRVLAVDTEVHSSRRVSRASQIELAGGGGTDMGAGIRAAAELRPRPSLLIVLTDGMTPWPEHPPRGVRVIVGLLTEGDFPSQWLPPKWARSIVIEDANPD